MKTNKTEMIRKRDFWEANRQSGGYLLKNKVSKAIVSVVRALLLFGLCFMIIQPLLTRFSTSLMPEKDLYDSTVILLPREITFDNYRIVADLTGLPKSMLNTVWTSALVSVLQVVACTLVGYGFARYDFPLKKLWFGCVIVTIIVPPQTIATALYMNFVNFDVLGIFKLFTGKGVNLHGSLVPYSLMSLTCMGLKNGLYIYMLRQYFKGIPKSLEEAAYVDGCGSLHTFVRIMLPDAMPTILSCFLFSFVWQWTDLFYTRNFLSNYSIFSNELSTILTRMNYYFSTESGKPTIVPVGRQMQLVSIGILICCIPLIILYIFTQRTFVESIAMSGTKE
ncbi:MAG: carbohydrate ABC transporter permease [Clostridia bacterium]|nr:carbohydrate ABC transporter permease [Clostridiales bacterium]MBQ6715871.1 carbohydrate ABC transporter permease [Clostridia bacterium]